MWLETVVRAIARRAGLPCAQREDLFRQIETALNRVDAPVSTFTTSAAAKEQCYELMEYVCCCAAVYTAL